MTSPAGRKLVFINQLQEGQQVRDLFLVSRKSLAETKSGKPYLALGLMDKTGEIEARIWDNAVRFNQDTEIGQIVVIDGQVKAYRDQLQLSVTGVQPVTDDSEPLHSFMPASSRSASAMKAELLEIITRVNDPQLRQLLEAVFQGRILKQFCLAPAAKMMHHAYLGGLLEHTLSVAGLAGKISEHYPALDRDLLIAGALLHDIGKISEFSFATVPFEYTDSGRLLGHLVLGSEMVRRHAENIPGFAAERLDQLLHLILSHHGRHEFGAPCLPMTIEAILLHHLDDMDAKVNYVDRLCEQVTTDGYQWSDYQRPLERFLLLKGSCRSSGKEERENSGPSPVKGPQDAKNNPPGDPKRQPTLF